VVGAPSGTRTPNPLRLVRAFPDVPHSAQQEPLTCGNACGRAPDLCADSVACRTDGRSARWLRLRTRLQAPPTRPGAIGWHEARRRIRRDHRELVMQSGSGLTTHSARRVGRPGRLGYRPLVVALISTFSRPWPGQTRQAPYGWHRGSIKPMPVGAAPPRATVPPRRAEAGRHIEAMNRASAVSPANASDRGACWTAPVGNYGYVAILKAYLAVRTARGDSLRGERRVEPPVISPWTRISKGCCLCRTGDGPSTFSRADRPYCRCSATVARDRARPAGSRVGPLRPDNPPHAGGAVH